MSKIFATIAFAALALTGCAYKVSSGGGHQDRLLADARQCSRETFAFSLIPDLGSTQEYQMMKCMKEIGWVRDFPSGMNSWAWAGPDSSRQLARYRDGREAVVVVCPRTLVCQPVVQSPEPAEWRAWAFEVHAASQFWRDDIVIVGDHDECESVRQREAARGVPTAATCRGPLYFKRAGLAP